MTSIEMRSRRSAFFIVERRSPLTLTLSRLPLTLRDAGLYITRPEKHEDFLQRRRIANIFLPAIKIFSLSSPLRILYLLIPRTSHRISGNFLKCDIEQEKICAWFRAVVSVLQLVLFASREIRPRGLTAKRELSKRVVT